MPDSSRPVVSLVVLAWNNLELTKTCVESLRTHTDVPYELIIVDNGSTDGGADFAADNADLAILNPTNLGFARGMNQGLSRASGDFVAFINNDTEFPPGWSKSMLERFREFPNVGIVAPAVTAAGNPVTVRSVPGDRAVVLTPFGEFPSGVVYVLPTDLVTALGGWNEEYGLASSEDLDLAFTVWAHGLDFVVDERVLIDHVSQASVRRLENRKTLYRQNLERFLERWQASPLGVEPSWPSVTTEQFAQNQRVAGVVTIWIRRMLDARDTENTLMRPGEELKPPKGRWFRSKRGSG